jgi:hypothetical protein
VRGGAAARRGAPRRRQRARPGRARASAAAAAAAAAAMDGAPPAPPLAGAPAAGGGAAAAAAAAPIAVGFKVQCVGLVKTAAVAGGANPVLNVLRGMCLRYETFERLEYGFSAPLQSGTSATSLRVFRHTTPKSAAKHHPSSANPFAPEPSPM